MMLRPRGTLLGLVVSLALIGGCDKGEGTKTPDAEGEGSGGAGAAGGAAEAEGGADYNYAAGGFTLTAEVKVSFEVASPEGKGSASMSAKTLLEATSNADKLEIHGKVIEFGGYDGKGSLDPEFMKKQAEEHGQDPVDIVAQLQNSEAWLVIDRKGKKDEAATDALPNNQGDKEDAPIDFGLFSVPDLPHVDLTEGEAVKLPTREDEQNTFGMVIPVEVDETWVLRGVDTSTGSRIAELDVTVETGGATEIVGQQGTAMISLLEESSFTIYFNLDANIPVSFNGYSASEISFDAGAQSGTVNTTNEIEIVYTAVAGSRLAAVSG